MFSCSGFSSALDFYPCVAGSDSKYGKPVTIDLQQTFPLWTIKAATEMTLSGDKGNAHFLKYSYPCTFICLPTCSPSKRWADGYTYSTPHINKRVFALFLRFLRLLLLFSCSTWCASINALCIFPWIFVSASFVFPPPYSSTNNEWLPCRLSYRLLSNLREKLLSLTVYWSWISQQWFAFPLFVVVFQLRVWVGEAWVGVRQEGVECLISPHISVDAVAWVTVCVAKPPFERAALVLQLLNLCRMGTEKYAASLQCDHQSSRNQNIFTSNLRMALFSSFLLPSAILVCLSCENIIKCTDLLYYQHTAD